MTKTIHQRPSICNLIHAPISINAGIPAIREAMQRANVVHEIHIYPGADHAFFNDTGQRYTPAAARAAWERTTTWFQRYLKS